jgi:putative membrane protein
MASFGSQIWVSFQGCIVVAGLFGAATSSKRILYMQAIPGALTLAATLLDI